jgi:hypothetical protein
MSDGNEVSDGQFLVYVAARQLYVIKPDHKLLRYVTQVDDDAVWEEFMTRFGKPDNTRQDNESSPGMAYIYAMYFLALEEACRNPDQEIIVHHRTTEENIAEARKLGGSNRYPEPKRMVFDGDIPF